MNVVSQGVRFSDNEMEKSSFGDTLVIINCSTERKDQVDNPKTGTLEDMHFCFFHLEVHYKFIGFELNKIFFSLASNFCSIARKRLYVPKIVSALKKRESSFKTILSEAVQVLVVYFNL